jgi:hypothetical protein
MLARQVLCHLSHMLNPICSGYFGDRVSFLTPAAWTAILLFYASCRRWDDRHTTMPSHFHFISQTFLFRLAQNCNFPALYLLCSVFYCTQLLDEMGPGEFLPG